MGGAKTLEAMNWKRKDCTTAEAEGGPERGTQATFRSIVAAVLYAAGVFCLFISVPTIVVGAWMYPPPGGTPAEALHWLGRLLGAGVLWVLAAFACNRAPWYVTTLLAAVGWCIMTLGIGDR